MYQIIPRPFITFQAKTKWINFNTIKASQSQSRQIRFLHQKTHLSHLYHSTGSANPLKLDKLTVPNAEKIIMITKRILWGPLIQISETSFLLADPVLWWKVLGDAHFLSLCVRNSETDISCRLKHISHYSQYAVIL